MAETLSLELTANVLRMLATSLNAGSFDEVFDQALVLFNATSRTPVTEESFTCVVEAGCGCIFAIRRVVLHGELLGVPPELAVAARYRVEVDVGRCKNGQWSTEKKERPYLN